MIPFIIVILSLIIIIIVRRKDKKINNPYFAFNVLWGFIGVLLIIGNKFFYSPSPLALWIVLVGFLGYNFSLLLASSHSFEDARFDTRHLCIVKKYQINYDVVLVLSFFVLVFSLYYGYNSIIKLINGVSLTDIRAEYFVYSDAESIFQYYFRNYVLNPLRDAVLICSIICVLCREKHFKLLIFNCFVILATQAITSGGRYAIINTIFMTVCTYSFYKSFTKINKKTKLIVFALLIIAIVSIIVLTNQRSTSLTKNMTIIERLWQTTFGYFAGSITYLGVILERTPNLAFLTLGINFIGGFVTPFCTLLNFLHIASYPEILNVIGNYASDVLPVGRDAAGFEIYYNALPTAFGYFYIDAGFVGTFFFSFIFGLICKKIYDRSANNLLLRCFYIFLFVQILNTSTRWLYFLPSYCLVFIYLLIIVRPQKAKC